eukprot:876190-Alexandrium_andersonii.AAC.1
MPPRSRARAEADRARFCRRRRLAPTPGLSMVEHGARAITGFAEVVRGPSRCFWAAWLADQRRVQRAC